MKRVYFIRHGETASNVSRVWQDPSEPLNDKGLSQAAQVAERVRHLKIDRIIASSMPRAIQTVNEISKATSIPYEISDLFREIKIPSSLIGAPHTIDPLSPQCIFRKLRIENAADANWHFDDEENPTDFLQRIKTALHYLEEQPEDNLLVVTHGGCLRCLLGYVVTAGSCDAVDVYRFFKTVKTINTGITVLEFSDDGWVVNTFNDHAHFAE